MLFSQKVAKYTPSLKIIFLLIKYYDCIFIDYILVWLVSPAKQAAE